jgi:hypothetical protein
MSLLFWLPKAPVRCIVNLRQRSAGNSRPDERVRHSYASPLVQALVADRVDIIVMRASGTFGAQIMIDDDGEVVTPTVRLLRADTVSEPLLRLPEAVVWAYHYDLQEPVQKRSMTRILADRMQVLDVR